MDPNRVAKASEAHPETMDLLSHAWCNFAVQTLQPDQLQDHAIVFRDFPANGAVSSTQPMVPKMERSVSMRMEDEESKSMPQWESIDLKSWIWMQQAMHPELNYNVCFKKKWFSWKIPPLKNVQQIKKWVEEIKEKRKEGKRVDRAEVHAAVSIAGLAAALAAVAAEKSSSSSSSDNKDRETALASAATLVAAQCAQMAELMGAKREQLSTIIGSAITATNTADILTLTAAAATSLRGAHALKARTGGCINRRSLPVLPIQDTKDLDSDSGNRLLLAKGARLTIETSEGRCMGRVVSLHLNNQTKIILKIKKLNFFNVVTSKKERIVLDQHIELYRDSEGDENETCYQISLTTTRGIIKLDMVDDYHKCKIWTCTINQMLRLSSSLTKYELQLSKY